MLVVGETTAEPLENVYVLAPLGTMVNELPEQIDPELTDMVGVAFTVKVIVAVLERQPKFVPVTEYVVVVVGETLFVAVVGPDNQLNVVTPPDAVNVVDAPLQIEVAPETEITGEVNAGAKSTNGEDTFAGYAAETAQFEIVPVNAAFITVPLKLFPLKSIKLVTDVLLPPITPCSK